MNAPFSKALIWVGATLLAIAVAAAGVQTGRLSKAHSDAVKVAAELAKAQSELAEAKQLNTRLYEANADLIASIEEEVRVRKVLQASLDEAVGQNQRIERMAAAAKRARLEAEAARDRALAALNEERGKLYASNPACDSWSRALVCGPLSGSLRDRWAAAQAARGGDREARGGGGDPPAVRADARPPDRAAAAR